MMTFVRPSLSRSAALAALVLLGVGASAHAQNIFDDFSSGNDNAWTRIDSSGPQFGAPTGYSVANGQYTITTPTIPSVGFQPFSGAARLDGAAINSQISVDIPMFTNAPIISLNARGFQAAGGGLSLYSLSFFPLSNAVGPNGEPLSNLRIDRYNADPNGGPSSETNITSFVGNAFPRINTTNAFRMVFTLDGTSLSGQLFDLTSGSLTPVQTVSAIDSGPLVLLGIGVPALQVGSNRIVGNQRIGASATFDNFRVVPAPGSAALLGLGGLLAARRRR